MHPARLRHPWNGILQARILEWVAIPSPGDLPDPEIEPGSPALAGGFFTTGATWESQEESQVNFNSDYLLKRKNQAKSKEEEWYVLGWYLDWDL